VSYSTSAPTPADPPTSRTGALPTEPFAFANNQARRTTTDALWRAIPQSELDRIDREATEELERRKNERPNRHENGVGCGPATPGVEHRAGTAGAGSGATHAKPTMALASGQGADDSAPRRPDDVDMSSDGAATPTHSNLWQAIWQETIALYRRAFALTDSPTHELHGRRLRGQQRQEASFRLCVLIAPWLALAVLGLLTIAAAARTIAWMWGYDDNLPSVPGIQRGLTQLPNWWAEAAGAVMATGFICRAVRSWYRRKRGTSPA
jgi:hypothetical protein